MAHNIFNSMFLANRGIPGWHGLGTVTNHEMNAEQSYMHVTGNNPLIIEKWPNHAVGEYGLAINTKTYSLIRKPFGNETTHVIMGKAVTDQYEVVQHTDLCKVFDNVLDNRITDTLFVLDNGSRLAFCYYINAQVVGKDEIDMFCVLDAPLEGSVKVMVTPIRPVCANTLAMGDSASVRKVKIGHNAGSLTEIGKRLSGIWKDTVKTSETIGNIFLQMADRKLDPLSFKKVLPKIIVDPPKPSADHHRMRDYDAAITRYESIKADNVGIREEILEYFVSGDETKVPDNNTIWGAYNAVSFYATHKIKTNKGGQEGRIKGLIDGSRAEMISRAATELMKVKV